MFKNLITTLMCVAFAIGTSTELGARQSCSNIHLVHIAGSTEEPGLGSVGKPLAQALANAIPGTTSYGLPYNTVPNIVPEFNQTVEEGAAMAATYLRDQAGRCPNQKFVLSGVSKGAIVMHSLSLDNDIKSKVLVIIVMGDPWRPVDGYGSTWPINSPSANLSPRNGTSSTENVVSFCNTGDTICETGKASQTCIPLAHLTYAGDGSPGIAADFVRPKVQK
ncbi:unnamed protein product [Rhizoctonia solani]|uniref:Cutinase n=1 Tax=Rhizoctonia solani TaxID=456999 RepID=A0A8H3E8C0_9AGAM|nr:unnamed protein product [Rhizoctonia solani]